MQRFFRDLDPEEFRGASVFVDIDGTLVPDGEGTLAPAEAHALSALTAVARVYFLAKKGYPRVAELAEQYGAESIVPDLHTSLSKAMPGIPLQGRRYVIGDQEFSDHWFATRIKATYIRVVRLRSGTEPLLVQLSYLADAVVWAVFAMGDAVTHSFWWPYVRVARPAQWKKSLLMLLPLFLAGGIFNGELLTMVLLGMVAFSASASVSYVIDDIIDCEIDARNPLTRMRPMACGMIHAPNALFYALFLAAVAVLAAAHVPSVIPWVMGYLALTHVYTFYLKRVPVVELFSVSGFYLLRLFGGAAAAGLVAPIWLVLVIFFASLLTASCGRFVESARSNPRAIIASYPADFLRLMPIFLGMLTLLTYTLVALAGTRIFAYSVGFMAIAIVWFLRSVYRAAEGAGREERLLDVTVTWGILALLGVYLFLIIYPRFL